MEQLLLSITSVYQDQSTAERIIADNHLHVDQSVLFLDGTVQPPYQIWIWMDDPEHKASMKSSDVL